MSIEDTIKEYIHTKNKEMHDGIRVPLSKMAEEFNYSTVTVWRTIQRLKDRGIIKVVKSMNKTEPDKIYYIGEGDQLYKVVDELIDRTKGILLILEDLRGKMKY